MGAYILAFVVMIQQITGGTTTVMDNNMHMKNSEPNDASSSTENILTPDLWESQYQPGDTFIKERVRSNVEQTDTEDEPGTLSADYTAQTKFSDSEKPNLREGIEEVYERAQPYASDSDIPKQREDVEAFYGRAQPYTSDSEKPKLRVDNATVYERSQQYASDSEIPKLRVDIPPVYERVQPYHSDSKKPKLLEDSTIAQSHAHHRLDSEKSKLRPPVYESAQPHANHMSNLEKQKLRDESTMIPTVYESSKPFSILMSDTEKENYKWGSEKPKLRAKSTIPASYGITQPHAHHVTDPEIPKFQDSEVLTQTKPSLQDVLRQGGTTQGAEQSDLLAKCSTSPKVEVDDVSKSPQSLFPKPNRLKMNETQFSKISSKVKKYLDNWAFKVHNFYKT